jgi:hypothetical protein
VLRVVVAKLEVKVRKEPRLRLLKILKEHRLLIAEAKVSRVLKMVKRTVA